jgi:putative hemolysin
MFEILIVFCLILLNGIFALSELAVVSARPRRLQAMAEAGRSGATAALALSRDPGRFLSTVQIGITLVGILAGAFSGAALGATLSGLLLGWGVPARIAEPAGFGLVIAVVTYFSIVIGELVPKRFALSNPEGIACTMAPAMRLLSRIAAPAAWLLDASTGLVFRLLRLGQEKANVVTDEEIRSLVAEAEGAGVIAPDERRLIGGVMRLGDRPVRGVMTPRTDIDWINLSADPAQTRDLLMRTQHSRLPAGEGTPDAMVGVVQTRELLGQVLGDGTLDIRAHLRRAPVIPDGATALDALAVLQKAEVPMALIHDEYGHFQGLVTPADLLETIAGAFRADADTAEPGSVQREDGSWLLAGWLAVDEMAELLALHLPPQRDYQTVAGYVLQALGRLPATGETVESDGWRFEVVDMDGHRIDKLLATPARGAIGRAMPKLHRGAG